MTETNNWTPSTEHPGYREKIIKRGNYTIHILRPELSDKEKAKVEARVQSVAGRVMKDHYKRKEENS